MTPRVSIVTPFLNAAPYIEEAIESVLAQTYDAWELLLVDDGSTDESTTIALRYAAAYPERIRYVAHRGRENRGASASRNLGAAHAAGEFLAYLDADDVYLPHKLQEQVPLLDQHADVAVVYGATEYWHSWTTRREDQGRDWIWRQFGAPPNTIVQPPHLLVAFLRDGGTVPCMGSVLVRRTAVEQIGGWEVSFRAICTDQVFHAKLCLHFPALIADVCWDRYRQHAGSSCQTIERAGEMNQAFERYLTWLGHYLKRECVVNRAIWSAWRKALRRYRYPALHRVEQQIARLRMSLKRVGARTVPRSIRQRLRARAS